MLTYNIDNGFIDGILRGYKLGLLTSRQYTALTQCETLEDYAPFFQQESLPLTTTSINQKCIDCYFEKFEYIRCNATGTLARFLEFIRFAPGFILSRYSYMIDNVILLISGTLHERDISELLPRCHPIGVFDGMEALTTSTSPAELYQTVLIASPLAPYFELCISAKDLNDKNLQIIRNILYKAYLEDFYAFCSSSEVDDTTRTQMKQLLEFESDRITIEIAVNSIKTGLSPAEKLALFPNLGQLNNPDISTRLAQASDVSDIQAVLSMYPMYRRVVDTLKSATFCDSRSAVHEAANANSTTTMDNLLYSMEVDLHRLSFFGQFHFANFYSFCKLKEQEIRNIVWIAECIAHKQRASINKFVPIF